MTITENKQVFIATIINYITIALAVIISIFYTPFCLATLGERIYGVRAFALSFVSFLAIISSSFAGTYLKFRAELIKEKGSDGEKINNGVFLFLTSALALIVLVVGVVIAIVVTSMPLEDYSLDEVNIIRWIIILAVLNVAIATPISVFEMFINANRKFIFVRTITLFSTIMIPLISVIVLLVCKDVNIAVILLGVVTPLVALLYFPVTLLYSFKKLHFKSEFHFNDSTRKLIKRITLFSIIILGCSVCHELIISANTTILGYVNKDAVTSYSMGSTLMVYLTTLGAATVIGMYPRLYALDTDKDYQHVNELFVRTAQMSLLIIMMVIGGFVSCGQYFIVSWLGKSISDPNQLTLIYQITCILFCSQIFNLSSLLAVEILRNRNKQLFQFFLLLGILVLTISISIPMTMWLGSLGSAISLLISMTIGYGIVFPIFNKKVLHLPIGKYFLNLLYILIVTAVSCGITYIFNYFLIGPYLTEYCWLQFLLCGLIFVIIYIGLCCVFFRNTILSLLRSIFKKKNKVYGNSEEK